MGNVVELTKKTASTTNNRDVVSKGIEEFQKNATIDLIMKSPLGIRKLAAVLTNPVRKHLDYVAICRKLVVSEAIPEGQIAYFDYDIEEFSGVKIGKNGSARIIYVQSEREQVDPVEIVVHPKVPFREIKIRKYKVFDRMKERLVQALAIREDLIWFSQFYDAAVLTNNEIVLAGDLTKKALTKAFYQVDRHRLSTVAVVMSPEAVMGIREWERDYIDEVARIEIRRTGYLGNLYGANFYVTNLIKPEPGTNYTYLYVLAAPEFLAWNPIYADTEIVPADRPDDQLLGLNGYELMGFIVHNSWAVARVKFVPSYTP